MIKTSRQLKDLIRNLSKENGIEQHVLIRKYMMERFLERVSKSKYSDSFILKGGVLLCGLGNGFNYVVDEDEKSIVYSLPFNPLKNKEHEKALLDEDAGYQFSHTIGEQLGGQLKAGFRLTHIEDDTNGDGRLHELNIHTYMMTRAVK